MMTRKMTSGLVFILVLLLATVPARSATPGPINPAGSGKSLTTDLNTAADYAFKTKIIRPVVAAAVVVVVTAAAAVTATE